MNYEEYKDYTLIGNEYKQVLITCKELKMSKGKIVAQCAHVAVKAAINALNYCPDIYNKWNLEGYKKIALVVETQDELVSIYELVKDKIPSAIVVDAGLTQIEPNSITAIAIGPWLSKAIDMVTKGLRLL